MVFDLVLYKLQLLVQWNPVYLNPWNLDVFTTLEFLDL